MNFKALALAATVALGGVAIAAPNANAQLYDYTTVRPNYGGGYNINSYGNGGFDRSTIRPNYSGGYNINHGDGSRSTIRPNYSGGWNINTYGL